MRPRRGAALAGAALAVAAAVSLSGCTTVQRTTTEPSELLPPADTPAQVYDVQLRQVLDVANAQAGQCGDVAPAAPDTHAQAQLCSADRTLLYTLAPAAVTGPEVSTIEAVFSSARPVVRITLTPQGGAGLVRVTTEAAQASPPRNQLALVSKGRVQTAVPVTDSIDGQVLEISGFDSIDTARKAADLLLPAATGSPAATASSTSS